MSDDVREAAARALYEGEPLPGIPTWDMAVGESDEWPLSLARVTVTRLRNLADAALAAIADHDGLVDVLRGHVQYEEQAIAHGHVWCASCDTQIGDWTRERGVEAIDAMWTAHLADVVRAWLRGEA